MARAALNLNKLSAPEKVAKCDSIVTAMTGNANFTTPMPTLKTVQAAIDQVDTDYQNALDGGTKLKKQVELSVKALMNVMIALCAYVQSISLGDPEIILSSNMDLARGKTPIEISQPGNFRIRYNGMGGLRLLWNRVKGAVSYVVQQYEEPASTVTSGDTTKNSATLTDSADWAWTQIAISSKTRFDVNNLVSGQKYWFRVAAVGAQGMGAWSSAVAMIAP
jgi:hypothetical protein